MWDLLVEAMAFVAELVFTRHWRDWESDEASARARSQQAEQQRTQQPGA